MDTSHNLLSFQKIHLSFRNPVCFFITYIIASSLNFHSFNDHYFVSLVSVLFVCLYVIVNNFTNKKWVVLLIFFILNTLLLFSPLAVLTYTLAFGKITEMNLFALFQSNSEEAYSFLALYFPTKYILFFVSITLLSNYLLASHF